MLDGFSDLIVALSRELQGQLHSVPERAILEYVSVLLELVLIEDVRNLIGSLRNVVQQLVDCCPRRDVARGRKFLAEDDDVDWAQQLCA
ncbi:type IV toxin-antitoxin system AbiEi family antitoxin domain-containing protein [Paraburkholderia xenovorans]|uniref:type IV toxin-antitoxin system AbiEi family antitoxin domain-containing protein n=1 Tax=Paraburkholderia xenovorans TaxID=36873 RepID=UPI00056E7488|nr:type IV toxin-antitoxin system AbiEi family antitoxin domain-containing protein [Paraburkholderia xenovorans]